MEELGTVELTYYTFSIGTAFQTSDVAVTTSHMRVLVTVHSAISFLYSTVLPGFVVAMIAGD